MLVAMHSKFLLDGLSKSNATRILRASFTWKTGLHGKPSDVSSLDTAISNIIQPIFLVVTLHNYMIYMPLTPIGRPPDQPLGCCKGRHWRSLGPSMNFTSHNSFPFPCRLERLRCMLRKGLPSRPLTFRCCHPLLFYATR